MQQIVCLVLIQAAYFVLDEGGLDTQIYCIYYATAMCVLLLSLFYRQCFLFWHSIFLLDAGYKTLWFMFRFTLYSVGM